MQTTTKNMLAGLALAGLIGSAHAVPVSLTEPITDFSSSTGSNSITNQSTTFSFDLTSFGYDSTLHTIDSALLALTFAISGPGANQNMTLDFAGQDPIIEPASDFNAMSPFTLSPGDFNLNAGQLAFSLQRQSNGGSVTLDSASLELSAALLDTGSPDSPTPIPEPGTLTLLALGLLGTVLFTGRRQRLHRTQTTA